MTGQAPFLRFTLRRQLIAVAYFAVLSAGLGPVSRLPPADAAYVFAGWVLLASPWVLGLFVWVFDRPGPRRDWSAAVVFFTFYPASALTLDLWALRSALRTGALAWPGVVSAVNLFMFASSFAFFAKVRPLACPTCARRSLIPLVRLLGQSRRVSRTRWCASCGGQFWRDDAGAWQPERRTTWAGPREVEQGSAVGPFPEP